MALPDPFERLTSLFRKLPGVGNKTARRMAFFVLQQPPSYAGELASCLERLKESIFPCSRCGNITDRDPCSLSGVYHVLGTRVSPLDGEDLDEETLDRLGRHLEEDGTEEVIIATNPCIEGDLTFHALVEFLEGRNVKISRIAYGLPVGGTIEFADRTTLLAALESRVTAKLFQQKGD